MESESCQREPKPIPRPNADTRLFWEACNREELVYQYCPACNRVQFYPRACCTQCGGSSLEWRKSAGLGSIYTFTINFRAPSPAFAPEVPYVIALVDLDEGFRLMLNVLDCHSEMVRIGQRVRIVYEVRDGQKIPQAVPAESHLSP
ncbi:MAG TPA: Zn-ribbon domain-containing OB-fold protein [Thermodesulfobacteriota bacterium]|nr:Zn-ribbon domain-containing OB-fold protein [Thermodesulfobacteriota bacterium]